MTKARRKKNPAPDFSDLAPAVLAARLGEREPAVLAWVASKIAAAEGNRARAARSLGVARETLWRWTDRHPELARAMAHARVDAAS